MARTGGPTPAWHAEAIALYDAGLSAPKIAVKFGVCLASVSYAISKSRTAFGLPPHPPRPPRPPRPPAHTREEWNALIRKRRAALPVWRRIQIAEKHAVRYQARKVNRASAA